MATGMQTGMRTGSRAGLTAGRGAPAKPSGGLGKIKDIWTGLGKGAKIGIVSLLVLAITGGICFSLVSSANKDVDLYTTKMTATDVKDVAQKLTENQIPHQVSVTGDGVLISPKIRSKAQALLAANGLPKHYVKTPTNTESSALTGKTAAEQKSLRQQMLEGEITESLRQFDGVADAYVKIAEPTEQFFKDDAKPITATVMIKLTPGTKLAESQVAAVVHLVSYSVPDLDKKNVKVVDAQMNDLTAMLEQGEDGSTGSSKQGKMETDKANELTKKAQKQLDDVFGAGKTKVACNVEYNFNQEEIKNKTVGGAGDQGTVVTGEQTKIERYKKDPGTGGGGESGAQMDGEEAEKAGMPSGDKKDSNYIQEIKSKKVAHNETIQTLVRKTPEIKRITCSVAVNNLKEDQVAKIGGLVKNAIGMNEERGDSFSVSSIPFSQVTLEATQGQSLLTGLNNRPAQGVPATQQGSAAGQMGVALSVMSLAALGLIGVFLMKQHRVQVGKSQPYLESSFSGSTSTDIADLVNDKSGKTTGNSETKVNTSDALEKLAKERPTKVAEMLKSTWLNG